jgi:hypothetical protein
MAIRGFGVQTVTGTPQPLFGTTLTAAFNVTPDSHTGLTDPRSQPSSVLAAVTSSTNFRISDRVMLGAAGGPYDWGKIVAIPDATHVRIQGLSTVHHASGEWLFLAIDCAHIEITANASTLYIGEDNTVGAGSATLYKILLPGGIYTTPSGVEGNMFGTSHYWVLGTAADTFLPNLTTI